MTRFLSAHLHFKENTFLRLQSYKSKKIKVEYVVPNTDQMEPIKYLKYTEIQLDHQLQLYKDAHPPPVEG